MTHQGWRKLKNTYSSVLGYCFHMIDCPKILVHHEFKKQYKVAFREAILAWNPTNMKELKDDMAAAGVSQENIENEMFYNYTLFKKCIEQRVLPPSLLYWQVRTVFVSYRNKIYSKSNKPLFNKAAWVKSNNLLKEIQRGLLSDPSGISFYSYKYASDGTIVKKKYGFETLSCNRGTNNIENVHKHLVTVYGTWHTCVEISSCPLRDQRHRHNHMSSQLCRLSFPTIEHVDIWLINSLQNIVQRNHGTHLYPNQMHQIPSRHLRVWEQ